jgi:predicted TIM-barrel enzyme
MSRLERQAILAKLQAMKKAGQPIIGGSAGTGLSAKCEEAGGIDLIVIYNSCRYRMAGRGSLAGIVCHFGLTAGGTIGAHTGRREMSQ